MTEAEFAAAEIIHESSLEFGAIRLQALPRREDCPDRQRYVLRLTLGIPRPPGTELGAALVGGDGSLLTGLRRDRLFRGLSDAADAPIAIFWQEWAAPSDFERAALRVAIGADRWLIPLDHPAPDSTPDSPITIEQTVRIVARIDNDSGEIQACLSQGGRIRCPADGGLVAHPSTPNRWRATAPIGWASTLPADSAAAQPIHAPALGCAYPDLSGFSAWQFNALAGSGTAVHVGERQFLVNGAQVPDGAPWGVVSRGDTALTVVRVAHDPRNDLALVELVDQDATSDLGQAASFATTTDDLLGTDAHLLSYPAGDAHRYLLAALNVTAMSERVIRVEPTGIRRHGAPLLDPCSGRVLAVSIGGDDLLRAETVVDSLAAMRRVAERPALQRDGPLAHGSAALGARPLYAGPVQPQFSGKICSVHPTERGEQHYAVYASSVDNPDTWRVYDEDGHRPETCDFGDKIFIVEYLARRAPEAVCIEPRRPTAPLSDADWGLDAPEGVELLLVRTLPRQDCPGLSASERRLWFSTHYFKLRNTGPHDFEDLEVVVVGDSGKEYDPRRDFHTFADFDVWGWRVNVTEDEQVTVVVTVE